MSDKELLIKTLNENNFDEIIFEYKSVRYYLSGWYLLEYEIEGKEMSFEYETIDELLNANDLHDNTNIKNADIKVLSVVLNP